MCLAVRERTPWIAKRAAKFIDQLGHNRVTLRCDDEPAIEALVGEIHKLVKREARPSQRETTSGRKPVQWIIGRAVGLVAGQARKLKAALEHRISTSFPLCWLVEFAAYLMNRCDIGSDEKTLLHRLHGRKGNTPIMEFGEEILYMPTKPEREEESGSCDSILVCLLAC